MKLMFKTYPDSGAARALALAACLALAGAVMAPRAAGQAPLTGQPPSGGADPASSATRARARVVVTPEAPALPSVSQTTATAAMASPEPAQPTPLSMQVEPAKVSIGEQVRLSLKSTDPAITAARIEAVTFEPDPERWHLVSPWRRDYRDPKASAVAWEAVLKPFELGTLSLPASTATILTPEGTRREVRVTTTSLMVYSVRPEGTKSELIGLRDPAGVPQDWSWLWTLAGGVACAVLLAWMLVRWWRRRSAGEPIAEPLLPPGLWALRELDRRRQLPVNASGPPKVIFSLVSEVVRLYLGRRYGFNAIDLTTTECMQALQAARPGAEVLRWVQIFLDECDLVKFTRYEPTPERWTAIWDDARLIVQRTTPPEELAQAAEGLPGDRRRAAEPVAAAPAVAGAGDPNAAGGAP